MSNIKISVVSYLNSKPFVYGIEKSGILKNYSLELDIPSICAEKLIDNKVDIGLVPVAVIPKLKQYEILTDYCIGAIGPVGSVMLYSEVELNKIEKILLDYQSRTSVALVQVLAKKFWKINPQWIKADKNYEQQIIGSTAAVVIGDRTFSLSDKFKYQYDLAEEWNKYTSLPFVFACWVANKKLPDDFKKKFNEAARYGIENRKNLIKELKSNGNYQTDISNYLNNCISYNLDEVKRKAMTRFLNYLSETSDK